MIVAVIAVVKAGLHKQVFNIIKTRLLGGEDTYKKSIAFSSN